MINRFTQFIEENQLLKATDKVLLAVSGGIDSMVMWKLFNELHYNYAVAHCNFRLRGEDSDRDEELVRRIAGERGVKLYVQRFDTREYAALTGISIEMAARELRYTWFEEIRNTENFHYLATAHHLDDLLETFFINLIRKTGIKGLTGFRPKTGQLLRPMLFTNRAEIEAYAAKTSTQYRTDRTNNELIYQRNHIRLQIIPQLEELNLAFRNNLAATIANLRDIEDFYQTEVDRQINRITNPDSAFPEISISGLLKLQHPQQVLFEWMSRFGFNPVVATQVFNHLAGEPGKQFFSRSHRLVIDRNALIITEMKSGDDRVYYFDENEKEMFEPVHITAEILEPGKFFINPDPAFAYVDFDNLQFPLVVKKWSAGEYFQPFGMTGLKKISDFFIDQKLSIPEKENIWIFYSGSKVVWITGQRIDHRFRITESTKRVLSLRFYP